MKKEFTNVLTNAANACRPYTIRKTLRDQQWQNLPVEGVKPYDYSEPQNYWADLISSAELIRDRRLGDRRRDRRGVRAPRHLNDNAEKVAQGLPAFLALPRAERELAARLAAAVWEVWEVLHARDLDLHGEYADWPGVRRAYYEVIDRLPVIDPEARGSWLPRYSSSEIEHRRLAEDRARAIRIACRSGKTAAEIGRLGAADNTHQLAGELAAMGCNDRWSLQVRGLAGLAYLRVEPEIAEEDWEE